MMHFAYKFAKQVNSSPAWNNLCLFPVVPKLGWGWQECCVKFHYWRPWTWKWGLVGVAKQKINTSYSPDFVVQKIRNLPLASEIWRFRPFISIAVRKTWNIIVYNNQHQLVGRIATPSIHPWRSGIKIRLRHFFISPLSLPLSKSSPPFSTLTVEAAGKSETYTSFTADWRCLQVHSDSSWNSIFWPLGTPAFVSTLSQGDLRRGIKFQPVFNNDEVASTETWLGKLGPLWSSWWLAWPSHPMGGFMWEKLDSHVKKPAGSYHETYKVMGGELQDSHWAAHHLAV